MGKLFVFFLITVGIALLTQGSYYFWRTAKRRWASEDAKALQEARRQALFDFQESEDSFEAFLEGEQYRSKQLANRRRKPMEIGRT